MPKLCKHFRNSAMTISLLFALAILLSLWQWFSPDMNSRTMYALCDTLEHSINSNSHPSVGNVKESLVVE